MMYFYSRTKKASKPLNEDSFPPVPTAFTPCSSRADRATGFNYHHASHPIEAGILDLDTTSALSIAELANLPFQPIRQENFRVPFSDYTYWYKCTLTNTVSSKKEWYLEWQTPVAERVEFYDPQPDGTYRIEQAGTLIHESAKKYSGFAPYCVVNLSAG